jgi:hypothetical protein
VVGPGILLFSILLFIEPSKLNRFCLSYFAVCAERKYLGCDRDSILRDPLLNLKKVNVVIDEDAHQVLREFKTLCESA